jgi:acyl-CoA thioester hydrolase
MVWAAVAMAALCPGRRPVIIPAPFDRYRGVVLSEWIDLNGHMNLAYYTVLFDYATDLLFDAIGIGRAYKDASRHGTFVAETHNLYERELLAGEKVRVATQILGADDKRIHLAHEMFQLDGGRRSATQELMFLSIDLGRRRVAPFLPEARQRVAAAAAAHAGLPRPDWVGRRLALPAETIAN